MLSACACHPKLCPQNPVQPFPRKTAEGQIQPVGLSWGRKGQKIPFSILVNKKGCVCKHPSLEHLPIPPLLGLFTARSMGLVHCMLLVQGFIPWLQWLCPILVLGKILSPSKHIFCLWNGCGDALLCLWASMFVLFPWPSLILIKLWSVFSETPATSAAWASVRHSLQ